MRGLEPELENRLWLFSSLARPERYPGPESCPESHVKRNGTGGAMKGDWHRKAHGGSWHVKEVQKGSQILLIMKGLKKEKHSQQTLRSILDIMKEVAKKKKKKLGSNGDVYTSANASTEEDPGKMMITQKRR